MRLPFPPVALGAGQLLGPALACGLNLYLTVTLLGLASRFGWSDAVPLGLRGLEHPLVIASALTLFAVEFVVDKVRYLDSAWDAVHTIVRPAAAALLGALALQDLDPTWQIAGAALAGSAALAAHSLKTGLRVRLNEARRRSAAIAASVIEDALAAALVLAAILAPATALVVSAALLTGILIFWPVLVRPATLGVRLMLARVRSLFTGRGWRGRADLPASLRQLVDEPELGGTVPLAARAALIRGDTPAGHYRSGWIVIEGSRSGFLYRRRLLGGRRIDLPRPCTATVRTGVLADAVDLHADSGDLTLLLLKDGPDPRLAAAELSRL